MAQTDETKHLLVNEPNGGSASSPTKQPSFTVGLIFCLLSGVFSSMLNLALAFGAYVAVESGR